MIKMNFTWIKKRSAWQDLEYNRARRAAFLAETRAKMDAVNSALSTAMQNKTQGIANLAAEAALKRVQAATKAKTEETIKQIDAAQKSLDVTKSKIDVTA